MSHHFVIALHVKEQKLIKTNNVIGYRVLSVPELEVKNLSALGMTQALKSGIEFCNIKLGSGGKPEFIGNSRYNYPWLFNGRYLGVYSVNCFETQIWYYRKAQREVNTTQYTVLARKDNIVYASDFNGKTRIMEIPQYSSERVQNFRSNCTECLFTNIGINLKNLGKILTYDEVNVSESNKKLHEKTEEYALRTLAIGSDTVYNNNGALVDARSNKSENVVIKNPVTVVVSGAWMGNKYIKRLTIGDGVASIEDRAFYGCTNMNKIQFTGNDVVEIGAFAFFDCRSVGELILPNNGSLRLAERALPPCLIKLTVPDKIPLEALRGALIPTSLRGVRVCKPGPHAVTHSMFYLAKDMIVMDFAGGGYIRSIADFGFCDCKSMTNIDLSKTVHLGYGALQGTALKSVELNEAQFIGEHAFADMKALRKLIVRSDKLVAMQWDVLGGLTFDLDIICNNELAYKSFEIMLKATGNKYKYTVRLKLDKNI